MTRLLGVAMVAATLAWPVTARAQAADAHAAFEGFWQPRANGAAYSVLPHKGGFFLGAGSDVGIVEGGELPYQPWAAERVKYLTAHMELDPTGHCHYEGIPHAMYFGFQIFVTPQYVAMIHENMHARRLVYTDGSKHPPRSEYLAWMGDSRGRWDGETLVIDTDNNNDKAVFDMAGHFHSDALHIVERFSMKDKDTLHWEGTFDDPKVFTRPFKMAFDLKRGPADYEMLESGCFDGERDAVHIKNSGADLSKHYDK